MSGPNFMENQRTSLSRHFALMMVLKEEKWLRPLQCHIRPLRRVRSSAGSHRTREANSSAVCLHRLSPNLAASSGGKSISEPDIWKTFTSKASPSETTARTGQITYSCPVRPHQNHPFPCQAAPLPPTAPVGTVHPHQHQQLINI